MAEEKTINIDAGDLTKITDEDLRILHDSLQGLLLKGQLGEEEFELLRERILEEMKARGIRPEEAPGFSVRPKDIYSRLMKSLIFLKGGAVKIEGKGEDRQWPLHIFFDKTGFDEAFKRAGFSINRLFSGKTDGLVFSSETVGDVEDVYDMWLVPKGRQITFKKEELNGGPEDFSYFFQLRKGSGQSCAAARSTSRKRTVVPGRFVRTIPLTRGVQPELEQTNDSLVMAFENAKFPVYFVLRRSELDVQIHKTNDKVRVWLSNGLEITKQVYEFVERFSEKKIPDMVILANLQVGTLDGNLSTPEALDSLYSWPRSTRPLIYFEAYDCLHYDEDVHMLPWGVRFEYLKELINGSCKTMSDFRQIAFEEINSPGHMIPLLNKWRKSDLVSSAFIYTNNPYSLNGSMLDGMVLYEKTFKFNAVVLDVKETHIPGVHNFSLGIDPGNLNFSDMGYVSINGKQMVRVGDSISTTRWSYPGDIVKVAAKGLMHVYDEERDLNVVRVFSPRIVDRVNTVGFPNGLPCVIGRAEKETLYYHRILDIDGGARYYNTMIDRSPLKVFKWETKPNEIWYRVRVPGLFQPNAMNGSTFKSVTIKKEKPKVRAIIGKLKGQDTTTVQSLRFPKGDGWTLAKAQAWASGRKFSELMSRGDGQGLGGPRQGDGGANVCVCPDCGNTQTHKKGVPCNSMKCPKCGTLLQGKGTEGRPGLKNFEMDNHLGEDVKGLVDTAKGSSS